MFDAVIFDFDGVLYDSEPVHLQACNLLFKSYGISIDQAIYFKQYVGLSDKEIFPLVLATKDYAMTAKEIDQLVKMKVDIYKQLINQNAVLHSRQAITTVLEQLSKSKKKIAICSGATREEIITVLGKLESGKIQSYFELIVSIEDVDQGKPSPKGYQLASQRLQVKPEACLVIEDSVNGIRAAKSAGMYAVGITGTHEADILKEADRVIHQLTELFNANNELGLSL